MFLNYFVGMLLIFFIDIDIIASNANRVDLHINWFQIGEKYAHCPALGWHIFTFIIFLALLTYFIYQNLINLLIKRANKIKDDIIFTNQLYITTKKNLKKCNIKIKELDKEFKNILSDFKNHKITRQLQLDIKFKNLTEQLHLNFNNAILRNIQQIKFDVKNKFINEIINEVINIHKKSKSHLRDKQYINEFNKNIVNIIDIVNGENNDKYSKKIC